MSILPRTFAVFDCAPEWRDPFHHNRYAFFERLSTPGEPLRSQPYESPGPFTIDNSTLPLSRDPVAVTLADGSETKWWFAGSVCVFESRAPMPIVDFLDHEKLQPDYRWTAANDEPTLCMVRQINQRTLRDRMHNSATAQRVYTLKPLPIGNGPPQFVLKALIRDAQVREQTCPITCLSPADCKTVLITGCFHWFEKTALQRWFQQHNTCPMCKATVSFTKELTV